MFADPPPLAGRGVSVFATFATPPALVVPSTPAATTPLLPVGWLPFLRQGVCGGWRAGRVRGLVARTRRKSTRRDALGPVGQLVPVAVIRPDAIDQQLKGQ